MFKFFKDSHSPLGDLFLYINIYIYICSNKAASLPLHLEIKFFKKIIKQLFFSSLYNNTMCGSLRTVNVLAYFFQLDIICVLNAIFTIISHHQAHFLLHTELFYDEFMENQMKALFKMPQRMQCVPLHVSASHKYNRLSLVAISCILTPFMSTVSSHPVTDRISVPAADSTFMINELRSSIEGCSRHMPARRKHRK